MKKTFIAVPLLLSSAVATATGIPVTNFSPLSPVSLNKNPDIVCEKSGASFSDDSGNKLPLYAADTTRMRCKGDNLIADKEAVNTIEYAAAQVTALKSAYPSLFKDKNTLAKIEAKSKEIAKPDNVFSCNKDNSVSYETTEGTAFGRPAVGYAALEINGQQAFCVKDKEGKTIFKADGKPVTVFEAVQIMSKDFNKKINSNNKVGTMATYSYIQTLYHDDLK